MEEAFDTAYDDQDVNLINQIKSSDTLNGMAHGS